jgi:hypothetical protein
VVEKSEQKQKLMNPVYICLFVLLVLVLLSKISSGIRRTSGETIHAVNVNYAAMCKWRDQSTTSKSKLLAYNNAVYARAYAETIRGMVDDAQSQHILGVNMFQQAQQLQAMVDKCTTDIVTACPALSPNGGKTVRTGGVA